MKLSIFVTVVALTTGGCPPPIPPSEAGAFEGEVVARWLSDGRDMALVEPFAYVEKGGRRWEAPVSSRINGASIPRALWSVVGGPYEGVYRLASVVHDVACDRKTDPWRAVHVMFYQAMIAGKTPETRAKVMYAAVYHFGPRWGDRVGARTVRQDGDGRRQDAMRMRQYIEEAPTTPLEAIEGFTSDLLEKAHPVIRDEMRYPPEHAEEVQ